MSEVAIKPRRQLWLAPTVAAGALFGAAMSMQSLGLDARLWWFATCAMSALAGHLGAYATREVDHER